MPASIKIKQPVVQIDYPCYNPIVEYYDGESWITSPYLQCLSISLESGIGFDTARFRLSGVRDLTGPTTLNAGFHSIPYGTRVRCWIPNGKDETGKTIEKTIFLGQFMRRHDQGQGDVLIWEAICDRWLYAQIPVRGALVNDPETGVVKFSSRYINRVNPEGYWNCCMSQVGGIDTPVFSYSANRGMTYQSSDISFPSSKLAYGTLTAWTPRRYLLYLQALCRVEKGDLPGTDTLGWRTLANSVRTEFNETDITAMVGKDPSAVKNSTGSYDPLDRKMPDMTFQGKRLLSAIQDTLDVAGTHTMVFDYSSKFKGYSKLMFVPIGFSGLDSQTQQPLSIPLQRGGALTDPDTAFDFELHEDASQQAESVLLEGATVQLETNVFYNPDIESTSTLLPAWTGNEEQSLLYCTNGSYGASGEYPSAVYAKVPKMDSEGRPSVLEFDNNGDILNYGDFVDADGTNGYPLAFPRTSEAAQLIQSYYPKVFKAFYLNTAQLDSNGVMAGVSTIYSDHDKYPVLHCKRPIYAEQLEFLLYKGISGTVPSDNWLKTKYPIRVEVKGATNTTYKASVLNPGCKMTPDGIIWFEGIGIALDGQAECMYDGSLFAGGSSVDPMAVKMKKIRVNLAFPLDHRVFSYCDINKSRYTQGSGTTLKEIITTIDAQSSFDKTIQTEIGGPTLLYIDSPDAYHEQHQVDSRPFGDTAAGIVTKLVEPGSEGPHAFYAAQRRFFGVRYRNRSSTWKMVGIRFDYTPGQWVDTILVYGGSDKDQDYSIKAPISNVHYDFLDQVTTLGGLSAVRD